MTNQFDFFQIDHGNADNLFNMPARTEVGTTIRRDAGDKMSYFGCNNVEARESADYTKTSQGFKDKDELSDVNVLNLDTGEGSNVAGRHVTIEHNPYILGSTVKRNRDDQFYRMSMSNDGGYSINAPGFDVMDENAASADGMTKGKNWPSEGWRSFGGKYDFEEPYQGGGVH